jgi:predicted transcriptional regulator
MELENFVRLKKFGKFVLTYYKYRKGAKMLSNKQKEIVTGSLLGDGCIWTNFVDPLCKLQIAQSKFDNNRIDKKQYLTWFVLEFIEIGCSVRPRTITGHGVDGFKQSEYYQYIFNTKCHEIWNELEKKWYIPIEHPHYRRKKIIPNDLKLSPLTLCIWHMDDGSNYQKDANIVLNTQGFTEQEVEFLIERLNVDLGIKAKRRKASKPNQFRIYVGRKSYFDYVELIRPHVAWDCFQYKLDTTTYNKTTQVGENHSQAKITEFEAAKIFAMRDEGRLHREIAKEMCISQSAVTQILNGKRWKHLNRCVAPKTKKRLTTEQKAKIVELLKEGKSQIEVATELGINQSTVSRYGEICLESI